ncbi:MAG: TPM domain-containing protein [Prevotellaceae bacterium]|nr:TPM domain-containing protein [Prevotellaceae bacterium]
MQPPRLVNDFAQLLTPAEQQLLEQKLRAYHDSTSTQVYVITAAETEGYTLAQLSPEFFKQWGIGQKGQDNGVLILIKPKLEHEFGEVFIGTGYGMEGVLPDVYCKRIIEQVIIPNFKNGNTYRGIDMAVDAVISYASGEYKGKLQGESDFMEALPWLLIFVVLVIIFVRNANNKGKGGGKSGGGGIPFIFPIGFGGGHSSGGSFGGGFGGGGGGRSGGGGAGGRW